MNKQPNIDPGETPRQYLLRVLPRVVKRAYYLQPLENRAQTNTVLIKTKQILLDFATQGTPSIQIYCDDLTPIGLNNLIKDIANAAVEMNFSQAGLKYEVRGHQWIDIDPKDGAK